MSSFTVSTVWGTGGVAACSAFLPASASTAATASHSTVTISAASHSGSAAVEDDDQDAVRAPSAEQGDDRRAGEHAGALAGQLALLGDLGLGELDLLADERRGLARQVLDQLADAALARILLWARR